MLKPWIKHSNGFHQQIRKYFLLVTTDYSNDSETAKKSKLIFYLINTVEKIRFKSNRYNI